MALYRSTLAIAAVALVPLTQAWNIELPPCVDSFQPFVYSGCFKDGNPNALVFRSSLDQTNMTVEKCMADCKGNGFRYAGLEYYGECFCGTTVNGAQLDESQCSFACSGNSTQKCGGDNTLSIWQDPTFVTTNVTVDSYKSLGCYTDDSSKGRTLSYPIDLDASTFNTKTCLAACEKQGYPFAGVEFGKECWCGVVLANDTAKVADSECNVACQGDGSSGCGGSSRINLWVAKDLESLEPCGYKPGTTTKTLPPATTLTTKPVETPTQKASTTSPCEESSSTPKPVGTTTSKPATSQTSKSPSTSPGEETSTTTKPAETTSKPASSKPTQSPSTSPCEETSTTTKPAETSKPASSLTTQSSSTPCEETSTTKPASSKPTQSPSTSPGQETSSTKSISTTTGATSGTASKPVGTTSKPAESHTSINTSPAIPSSPVETGTKPIITTKPIRTTEKPTTTSKEAPHTTAELCTATVTIPPACEWQCGDWCAPALPAWGDKPGCELAQQTCHLQVSSCFQFAGFPGSLECFKFKAWCLFIDNYCDSDCPGEDCGKWNCWGKHHEDSGHKHPGAPPTATTTVFPCPVTPTPEPTPPEPVPTCSPQPTNICTQPCNERFGYGPGKPVGGIALPVVACNDCEDEFAEKPFKFYTDADTRQCPGFPWFQWPNVCEEACKVQFDQCVAVYSRGCDDQGWRDEAWRQSDESDYDFSKRWLDQGSWGGDSWDQDQTCAAPDSGDVGAWTGGVGSDGLECWGWGGNNPDWAIARCKAQYADCIEVNQWVDPEDQCRSWDSC